MVLGRQVPPESIAQFGGETVRERGNCGDYQYDNNDSYCRNRRSTVSWCTVDSFILVGLLLFTIGLIVGALLSLVVVVLLPTVIALAIVWLVLLIIVRIACRMRYNNDCGC